MKDRPVGYLAAPLFSQAELQFNRRFCEELEDSLTIYLPQRDGVLLRDLREAGLDTDEARHRIYEMDLAAIRRCDVVIAVLDGPTVDDGVCFELGYATCLGKVVIGLATDSRRAVGYFRNPMWECALHGLFSTTSEVVKWAQFFRDSRRWVSTECVLDVLKTGSEMKSCQARQD